MEPNGCVYVFHLTTGGVSPYPATVDVKCPAGKAIAVKSGFSNCVLSVGEQTGLEGVTFTNTGTKTARILDVSLNISGIKYTETGSNCSGPEGAFTNGTMKGGATVKADVGSTTIQQGLWIA